MLRVERHGRIIKSEPHLIDFLVRDIVISTITSFARHKLYKTLEKESGLKE